MRKSETLRSMNRRGGGVCGGGKRESKKAHKLNIAEEETAYKPLSNVTSKM